MSRPEAAPWLDEYLHENGGVLKREHDDQLDSAAQFLDWFKRPFPKQDISELCRQLAQEAEQRSEPQPAPFNPAPGSRH